MMSPKYWSNASAPTAHPESNSPHHNQMRFLSLLKASDATDAANSANATKAAFSMWKDKTRAVKKPDTVQKIRPSHKGKKCRNPPTDKAPARHCNNAPSIIPPANTAPLASRKEVKWKDQAHAQPTITHTHSNGGRYFLFTDSIIDDNHTNTWSKAVWGNLRRSPQLCISIKAGRFPAVATGSGLPQQSLRNTSGRVVPARPVHVR